MVLARNAMWTFELTWPSLDLLAPLLNPLFWYMTYMKFYLNRFVIFRNSDMGKDLTKVFTICRQVDCEMASTHCRFSLTVLQVFFCFENFMANRIMDALIIYNSIQLRVEGS